jgi:HAMP domain-containing protein
MDYKEIKIKESKTLLNMAWLLEIIFCITGLFIAFTLSTSNLETLNFKTITSPEILVGLLPLVAIALVELSKIPTVNVFLLSKSISTKFIAGLFLLCICGMTFETMSTGLEQNVSNRENHIKESRLLVNELNEEILNLNREITEIENVSSEDIRINSEKGLKVTLSSYDTQIVQLNKRKIELTSAVNSPQFQEYKRQLKDIEVSLINIEESYRNSLGQLNAEISDLNSDEQEQLSGAFFKNKIVDRFQERRDSIKIEKNHLLEEFQKQRSFYSQKSESINNQIVELIKPSQETTKKLKEINQKIDLLESEKLKQIKNSSNSMSVLLSNSELNQRSLKDLQVNKNAVQKKLLKARKDLAHVSDSSFIHRMAGKFHGVNNAADLTEKQIGSVSLFFVLSVALVVAISGPLLAFCSMKMRIERQIDNRKPLSSAIRKTLLSLRRRFNKPKVITEIREIEKEVEKIVEVEVEKKIYETVEVPTPYEVTKFVAVPVPTELKDLTFSKHLSTELIESNEISGSVS